MRIGLIALGLSWTIAPLAAAEPPAVSTQGTPPPLVIGAHLTLDDLGHSLFDLIRTGDLALVTEFLDAHPTSINERGKDLAFPLHTAVDQGHWEIAELLETRGANVNAINGRSQTALVLATIADNAAAVATLLNHKAATDLADSAGQTALHYAVRAGNAVTIASLIEHGASVEKIEPSKGYSAIALALSLNRDDLAQQMIASLVTEKNAPLFYYIHNDQYENWQNELDAHPALVDSRIAGGWSMLHQAVLDKRPDHVKYLLEHGFDTLARDCGRRCALHIAALNGDADMVTRLFQAEADANVVDERGVTPLLLAIRNNNLGVTELLLTHGSDPNVLPGDGRTAAFAMATCSDAMADLLLKHEIHLNVRDPLGRTVLYYCLDNPKRTALLLANGAAVNPKDKAGKSLLHEAAVHAPGEVVLQLIKAGVPLEEPDSDRRTALHVAALNNNIAAAQVLIDNGANLNARDKSGDMPLHYAVYNLPITALLLAHHAECGVVDYRDQWTALDVAIRNGDPEARTLLKSHREMLTAASEGDLAAMQTIYATLAAHQAAAEKDGKADIAKIFAAAPASINSTRDHTGASPLMIAAAGGFKEVVAALIRAGADPKVRDDSGATAYMRAAENNRVLVMQFLAQKQVDCNAVDAKGQNALHKAAAAGALEAVQMLLAGGSDRDAKDQDGQTALDLATAAKKDKIVALLNTSAKP